MKNVIYIILFVLCCGGFLALNAQITKTLTEGEGNVEIGLGYNKLFGYEPDYSNPDFMGPTKRKSFSVKDFYLTPTFRLSYEMVPLEWLTLRPFIGYDVFGGLWKSSFNEFGGPLFYSLEIGLLINYKFHDIQIGGGIKYNNHLKMIVKAISENNKTVEELDVTDAHWYEKESFDLGLRLSYRVMNFTIASEFWFSITNLAYIPDKRDEFYEFYNYELMDYKKNRFTLLIGYQF